ncbi:TonB-dependent receptor domain-containing protein [Chitinophaga lutea]
MKKTFLLLLYVILYASAATVHAQSAPGGKITVKVTDAAGAPLQFASVTVRKAADTALVKGQMSDQDGLCLFEKIAPGSYRLQISQMGFTTQTTASFQIDAAHPHADLKTIALAAAPKNLQTVNVTAQRPFIERSEGKTIMNVESSVAAAGNNALDLLRRAPGVTVDKDDNLLLKGKSGVTVMLDGKLTYLSNEALAELLRSMSAETISQIEIITNPGAKYDAQGTSGIINIKTKKGQMTGFNGTVNASFGGGRYVFYNAGVSLNWREKKFNIFGNLNTGDRQNYVERELKRRTGGQVPLAFHQVIFQPNDFLSRGFKAGIDYYLSPNHTIGAMANGYSNAFWRYTYSSTSIRRQDALTPDSSLESGISGNNRFRGTSYNLNYKFKIDTLGSELTMDADYAHYYNRMHTYVMDSMVDAKNGAVLQRNAMRTLPYTNINIYSVKTDFVKALTKSIKMEAGAKASFVNTGNNMALDSLYDGAFVPVPAQYDEFQYKERVLAGYVNYKQQWKKVDLVLGLRLEQTHSDGNSLSTGSRIKRDYLDYFPNFSADYKFTDDHKVGLTYSKRINRPGYGMLNPFMFFLDKYTYFQGNPFLAPEYIHNAELNYVFKQKYIFALAYSHLTDSFDEWLIYNEKTKGTISTNRNLGTQRTYALNMTLPFEVTKWWNSSNNVSTYYNIYNIRDTSTRFNNSNFVYGFNSTNTFTLPKDYKIELSGWYESPNVFGIWRGEPMWMVNAGVQKSVLKKKGTLKVNVNDIFANTRFRGTAEYGNVYLYVNNRWSNRTINLSFSYRFGNSKVEAARERKSGSEEESRRAGN